MEKCIKEANRCKKRNKAGLVQCDDKTSGLKGTQLATLDAVIVAF